MSQRSIERFGIPTTWNGIRFRSKLEMYVARELHLASIKLIYEPEPFTDDWASYKSDFYLPQQDCLLEVKPRCYLFELDAPKRQLIEKIAKQVVVVDFHDPDGLVPLLMFGFGDACDRSSLARGDTVCWSNQLDRGKLKLEWRPCFPCPFFTTSHACLLRARYSDDCLCSR